MFKYIIFILFLFINLSYCINDDLIKKCVNCHMKSGNSSVSIWPKIAGQYSNYMLDQLIEFKKGKNGFRFDITMYNVVKNMTENELFEISEYYSGQKISKTDIIYSRKTYDLGKYIYFFGNLKNNLSSCMSCHGPNAMGNELAKIPVLRWQNKEYIVLQFNKFKNNERFSNYNNMMKDISLIISEKELNAVSYYLSVIE